MRSFALAIIAAVANAARPHEFFAENNLICELCKKAVEHSAKGRNLQLEALFEHFPKLEQRFNEFAGDLEKINLTEPEATC